MGDPPDHVEELETSEPHPLGCTVGGDELLAIGQALRTAVGAHLVERERASHGLVLRIARHPGAATALRDYARREQACCSFFDVAVTEEAEILSVSISGPPEAAPLLDLLAQLAGPVPATS